MYAHCNGGPPRLGTTSKRDESHSIDQLDTWMTSADEETEDKPIAGRFSWSLACLKDLENGNESTVRQSLVKSIVEDDNESESLNELTMSS